MEVKLGTLLDTGKGINVGISFCQKLNHIYIFRKFIMNNGSIKF